MFEAIPALEFDQTANLAAEAGHVLWTQPAGVDTEAVSELEFDQALGVKSALSRWHMRRSVGGCGSGAGRVR